MVVAVPLQIVVVPEMEAVGLGLTVIVIAALVADGQTPFVTTT